MDLSNKRSCQVTVVSARLLHTLHHWAAFKAGAESVCCRLQRHHHYLIWKVGAQLTDWAQLPQRLNKDFQLKNKSKTLVEHLPQNVPVSYSVYGVDLLGLTHWNWCFLFTCFHPCLKDKLMIAHNWLCSLHYKWNPGCTVGLYLLTTMVLWHKSASGPAVKLCIK